MPNIINAELASWAGETIVGTSGNIYRLDDPQDGTQLRVWVWDVNLSDLDPLFTAAGNDPANRDEALAILEQHNIQVLTDREAAAKQPAVITWDGIHGTGMSGETYTIEEFGGGLFKPHTGQDDTAYYLETTAAYEGTVKAAKRVAERHEKQLLADEAAKQPALRTAAAKWSMNFGKLTAAVEAIEATTDRQKVLSALDTYRAEAFDKAVREYWVFPGVPIEKFSERIGTGSALQQAERRAAEWAEETKDQSTVVFVRSDRNPDGSVWSPAVYAQWQGVHAVGEDALRPNVAQERI